MDGNLKTIEQSLNLITEFLSLSVPIDNLPQVDAIFVFGHYEPKVAHHAAWLWKNNKAPIIVIAGKGRDAISEGFNTEADYFASLIEACGVSRKFMILEKESTNTLENILFGIDACSKSGLNPDSLILCAMPPLLRRSSATFQKQFPNVAVYGSAFPVQQEWYTARRIKRLLGEFVRLSEYAKKGDIVEVEIPKEIIIAIEKVRQVLP